MNGMKFRVFYYKKFHTIIVCILLTILSSPIQSQTIKGHFIGAGLNYAVHQNYAQREFAIQIIPSISYMYNLGYRCAVGTDLHYMYNNESYNSYSAVLDVDIYNINTVGIDVYLSLYYVKFGIGVDFTSIQEYIQRNFSDDAIIPRSIIKIDDVKYFNPYITAGLQIWVIDKPRFSFIIEPSVKYFPKEYSLIDRYNYKKDIHSHFYISITFLTKIK